MNNITNTNPFINLSPSFDSESQYKTPSSLPKRQQFPLDTRSMAPLQRVDLLDRDACGALAPDKERNERDASVMEPESGRQRELLPKRQISAKMNEGNLSELGNQKKLARVEFLKPGAFYPHQSPPYSPRETESENNGWKIFLDEIGNIFLKTPSPCPQSPIPIIEENHNGWLLTLLNQISITSSVTDLVLADERERENHNAFERILLNPSPQEIEIAQALCDLSKLQSEEKINPFSEEEPGSRFLNDHSNLIPFLFHIKNKYSYDSELSEKLFILFEKLNSDSKLNELSIRLIFSLTEKTHFKIRIIDSILFFINHQNIFATLDSEQTTLLSFLIQEFVKGTFFESVAIESISSKENDPKQFLNLENILSFYDATIEEKSFSAFEDLLLKILLITKKILIDAKTTSFTVSYFFHSMFDFNQNLYYLTTEKLGKGSYGSVLKAFRSVDGECFAIKKPNTEKTTCEIRENINSLLLESKFLDQIKNHDPYHNIAIIRKIDLTYIESIPNLVLELAQGNLRERLTRNSHYNFSLKLIKKVGQQLFEALVYLRKLKIVHTDIKPENILINNKEKVLLADFGSAFHLDSKKKFTHYIQTRWYRSPECLLRLVPLYHCAMDCWSLGAVLEELFIKSPLFEEDQKKGEDLLVKHEQYLGPYPQQLIIEAGAEDFVGERPPYPRSRISDLNKKRFDALFRKKTPTRAEQSELIQFNDLIERIFTLDPRERISSSEVLEHPFFLEEAVPLER